MGRDYERGGKGEIVYVPQITQSTIMLGYSINQFMSLRLLNPLLSWVTQSISLFRLDYSIHHHAGLLNQLVYVPQINQSTIMLGYSINQFMSLRLLNPPSCWVTQSISLCPLDYSIHHHAGLLNQSVYVPQITQSTIMLGYSINQFMSLRLINPPSCWVTQSISLCPLDYSIHHHAGLSLNAPTPQRTECYQ